VDVFFPQTSLGTSTSMQYFKWSCFQSDDRRAAAQNVAVENVKISSEMDQIGQALMVITAIYYVNKAFLFLFVINYVMQYNVYL